MKNKKVWVFLKKYFYFWIFRNQSEFFTICDQFDCSHTNNTEKKSQQFWRFQYGNVTEIIGKIEKNNYSEWLFLFLLFYSNFFHCILIDSIFIENIPENKLEWSIFFHLQRVTIIKGFSALIHQLWKVNKKTQKGENLITLGHFPKKLDQFSLFIHSFWLQPI